MAIGRLKATAAASLATRSKAQDGADKRFLIARGMGLPRGRNARRAIAA
jgi:hypothetical protein